MVLARGHIAEERDGSPVRKAGDNCLSDMVGGKNPMNKEQSRLLPSGYFRKGKVI